MALFKYGNVWRRYFVLMAVTMGLATVVVVTRDRSGQPENSQPRNWNHRSKIIVIHGDRDRDTGLESGSVQNAQRPKGGQRMNLRSTATGKHTSVFNQNKDDSTVDTDQGSSHHQMGCKMQDLRVEDPEIAPYLKQIPPADCDQHGNKQGELWVTADNGTFNISQAAIAKYGPISCDYKPFWRISDKGTDKKVFYAYKSGSPLKSDFFTVRCRAKKASQTYENVQTGINAEPATIQRARDRSKHIDRADERLNVVMLGFDSMSRMMFMRKMPKTYEYLTKTLGAVVLKQYNIVGDGTPQALIPILTGKTEPELPLTRKRFPKANFVNVYPFIWNDFRDAGYVTLYGEDAAAIGTFTYRLKGFNQQPTDHYQRTFYQVQEGMRSKFKTHCIGPEPHHTVHFRYVSQFFDAYPEDIPKFAFSFHSIYSHDDFNLIQMADKSFRDYLTGFQSRGWLNNTVLILMADHGHRFASVRKTQQGKLEERLPFFSIALPPWFKTRYPDAWTNLVQAQSRLTSPFDIYATFRDIVDRKLDKKYGFMMGYKRDDPLPRGMSLFRPIPEWRSCAEAQIEAHWCACLEWKSLPIDDDKVNEVSDAIVQTINQEIKPERRLCSELYLDKITSALIYTPQSSVMTYKKAKDYDGFVPDLSDSTKVTVVYYQIRLLTNPGGAHYEASVAWDHRTNTTTIDLNSISVINAYGDRPHCIVDKNYFLAKYCVCYDRVKG